MTYDFDKLTQREGTGAAKWCIKPGELPMWVADMDFETAPEVVDALIKRAKEGIFGYSMVTDEWYDAVCTWWRLRHNFTINKEWLRFCQGVIPAISNAVRCFAAKGQNVLVQSPVYNHFYVSIESSGRTALESPLKYNGTSYEVDFADLEAKLAMPDTALMILCNPQNPTGQIWDKATLAKIGALCKKYDVLVVSDEIHCDLTDPGCEYTPFASVNDECAQNSITCIAPTKTFNLAGIQTAAIVVPNKAIRETLTKALQEDDATLPTVFAEPAAVAAFTCGAPWLDALRGYIYEGKQIVGEYLKNNLPQIKLVPSEATYLLWLDCSAITNNSTELAQFIRAQSGLWLTEGSCYRGDGDKFLRMNIATQHERIKDGLARLEKSVKAYMEQKK